MSNSFSHLDENGQPGMVDVSAKNETVREARAQSIVYLGKEVAAQLSEAGWQTKKGSIIQTATIAGTMGAKKTSDLIPLCHPLGLDSCKFEFETSGDNLTLYKTLRKLNPSPYMYHLKQDSKTIIGATEAWTIAELTKSGWPARNCNAAAMVGVAYCLDFDSRQGYVITGEAAYDARNPGNDGGALLAHEYFHLVQASLSKTRPGEAERNKSTNASSVNAFPIWFIEGTAEFVGYSVGALAQNATYWEGRARMLSYSPPDESINKNAISDYEIRICCGNNAPTYPYHIGQIATEFIVASVGFQKMLDIMIDYGTTRNFEKSFETVTGISKSTFYEKFEQLRPKVGLPPVSWKLEGVTNKRIDR